MEDNGQFFEVVKKIQAKARLARIGSIPLNELGRLKACMLNTRSQGQTVKFMLGEHKV